MVYRQGTCDSKENRVFTPIDELLEYVGNGGEK